MIGQYGEYVTGNKWLSLEEMKLNATYIYNYCSARGWTMNAICGMLGNLQRESTINPGIWQNLDEGNTSLGFGLVQWTPASNYLNWCNSKVPVLIPGEMDSNLARIDYEIYEDMIHPNSVQWRSTPDYPISFNQFILSNGSLEYTTTAFLKNYERAGVEALDERIANAYYWFNYLGGVTPTPVVNNKKKGFNFVLFGRKNRRII